MKCLFKRVLPLVITLIIGIAASIWFHPLKRELQGQGAEQAISHSRTWLRIHSQPAPNFPKEAYELNGRFSVRLYVRLDSNGTVSEVIPIPTPLPSSCIEAAVDAAKRIKFTPATEDGKPISTNIIVEYGFIMIDGDAIDTKTGRRYGFSHSIPSSSRIEIVSVIGAQESEGWRVLYE